MRVLQKMKRMSIYDVQREFSEIEKSEQALYVGMVKYEYYKNGTLKSSADVNNLSEVIISVEGRSDSVSMSLENFQGLKFGHTSESTAKNFFEYMAKNTDVEWGMTIKHDGNAKVYTSNLANKVDLNYEPSNTKQVIHSHVPGYELSTEDKNNAEYNPQIQWTVYQNGRYQDYDKYGLYGGTYY